MANNAYGNDLRNTLVDRSMKTAGPTTGPEYPDPSIQGPRDNSFDVSSKVPTAPTGLPAPPPAGGTEHLPPAWKRYSTGLKMQNAYANSWSPNPILLRLLDGK